MTEEAVREIFFKNYFGRDLNKELIVCLEEIFWATFREIQDKPEGLDDIMDMIFKAQSRIRLFLGMASGTTFVVPSDYLDYLDFIRGAIVKIFSHLISAYETTDPWFKEKFTAENLRGIRSGISLKVETTQTDKDTRSFQSEEIRLYADLLNIAVLALIGRSVFNKFFIEKLNKSMAVLRQCQQEALTLNRFDPLKTNPAC